jgi:tripartite-type tricarboxylate transporter receptor subunit TctC
MKIIAKLSLAAAACYLAFGAQADEKASDYPSKPVRIMVGYAAGGTTDVLARILASELTRRLGVQFVIDNRAGAGGQIASLATVKAPADGYTLLITPSGSHTVNPSLYKKLPYDTTKDFAPVTLFGWVSNLIVTAPDSKLNSLQDVIKEAKARPGQLTYGSAGTGTVGHLSSELLKMRMGIDMIHVPYKGGGPALTAVAANETTLMFAALPSSLGFLRGHRIKALAVTSPQRIQSIPDVPTLAEAGLADLSVMEWYGVFAPANTPPTIVEKLHREIGAVVNQADVKARFAELGTQPVSTTPAELALQIEKDMVMWSNVVRTAGTKVE